MLKTSLVYLLLAFLAGLLQAGLPFLGPNSGLSFLRPSEPVRVHLLVVGWITLLIFGVVYWMFPKYSRELPRGHAWLGWVTYALLNAGLVLRLLFEGSAGSGSPLGWVIVASAVLQWLAALAFIINTWPRIKEK